MAENKNKYFPQDKLPELLGRKNSYHQEQTSQGTSPQPVTRPYSANRKLSSSRPRSAVTPPTNRPPSATRPYSAVRPASATRPSSANKSQIKDDKNKRPKSATEKNPHPDKPRPGSPNKGRPGSPNKTRPGSPNKARPCSATKPRPGSANKQKTDKENKQNKKTKTSSEKNPKDKRGQSDYTEDGLKKLDASSQGMTNVPTHIINDANIGVLNLSSNNLRSLPLEINQLVNLRTLDLSKNGIKCMHPKDYSGLPEEFGELKSLRELYISECNLPFVPPAIWALSELNVLDISRNKINVLPADVAELASLVKLNLQQTNITYLPPEIACCQNLEQLLLYGNKLDSLPETLADMPKLRVLAVNYRSFCTLVDGYMESLISKGQINSEHIPLVVFELSALENLDLECTKINTVPEMCMDKLQEFSLYKNFIYEMPETIYKLASLQIFDISKNFLKVLPGQVSLMKHLTVLRVNDNSLDKIPESIGSLSTLEELEMGGNRIRLIPHQMKQLTRLKRLVLDRNDIQNLPSDICDLTELETLDLTQNSISQLPIMLYKLTNLITAHTYNGLRKHGLWLYKNPLKEPPEHIWKTDKPLNIYNYLKKLQISRTENLQRQKIVLLGNSGCGKTSLIDALVLGKTTHTTDSHIKTKLLDQVPWHSEDGMSFLVYELGGDSVYTPTYPLFLDRKALAIVVFDCSNYSQSNYQESIGRWLDFLQEHIPGCVVKIVATKCDLIKKQAYCTPDLIWQDLCRHISQRNTQLENEILKLNEQQQSGSNIQEELLKTQRVKLQELSKTQLQIIPGISFTSVCESFQGIQDLVHNIEISVINKSLFPSAQRYIPEQWHKVKRLLKRETALFLPWEHVVKICHKFHSVDIEECIQYLHDIGEILWLKESAALRDIVFHRPRSLVELISTLYRHDVKDFLSYTKSRVFSSKGGLTEEEFHQATHMLYKYGQISRPLLKCLWFYLELDNSTFHLYLELLPKLSLCYTIPEPAVPEEKGHLSPLLVLPWNNKDNNCDIHQHLSPEIENRGQITITYTFPFSKGEGIFQTLIIRLQDNLIERTDWQNAMSGVLEGCCSISILNLTDSQTTPNVQVIIRERQGSDLMSAVRLIQTIMNEILYRKPGLYCTVSVSTLNCDKSDFDQYLLTSL